MDYIETIKAVSSVFGLVLQVATLITLIYAFYKFMRKPHNSLEEKHEELVKRVDKHDLRIDDIEESLLKGNDKFRQQEETNAVFKSVMLSFVNFEIAFCLHTNYEDTGDLMDAKRELNAYLKK